MSSPLNLLLPQTTWWKKLPESLQRPGVKRYLPEIDGLRWLAIMPVVIQHLAERLHQASAKAGQELTTDTFSYLASRGFSGVFLFFALSGFIIALPFFEAEKNMTGHVSLKQYFSRRLSRLEPPFVIIMIMCFVGYLGVKQEFIISDLLHFLAAITYTHGFWYESYNPINPVTWSLEVEIQFYLLAPLLMALLLKLKNPGERQALIAILIFVIGGLQLMTEAFLVPAKLHLWGHLHLFLAGILAADLYLNPGKTIIVKGILADLFFSLAVIATFLLRKHEVFSWVLYPLWLFLIIHLSFHCTLWRRFLNYKWISGIGGMCYTIYLIHLPLAEAWMRVGKSIISGQDFTFNMIVHMALFLPIAMLISSLVFLYLERPCMVRNWPALLKQTLAPQKSVITHDQS